MKVRPFVAILVVLTAPTLGAQQSESKSADAEKQLYVYVIRNDRRILNGKNADALIRTNIAEPALNLADNAGQRLAARVKCKKPPCSAEAIVDEFFDYYGSKFPTTAAKVSEWVRRNNPKAFRKGGAAPGAEIELPCLPISPQQDRRIPTGSRMVIPCEVTSVGTTAASMTATIASTSSILPEDPRRKVNETVERMTLDAYRLAFPTPPSEELVRVVTARGDVDDPANRRLDLEFLGPSSGGETDCQETPFRNAWEQRLPTLNLQQMQADARQPKLGLVLIDWDFQNGHGKQVQAVARRMLQCLKVDGIDPAIVDLHPRRDPDHLKEFVVHKCKDSGRCDADKAKRFNNVCSWKNELEALPKGTLAINTEEDHYLDALCWIQETDPPEGLDQRVDQYVLQAVFEGTLEAGYWMNISFDMRRDQAESIRQSIADKSGSRSMIFAAAGNSGTVSFNVSPQGLALIQPARVVNVTFGTSDGSIAGATSSNDPNGKTDVTVLAPGSGFHHQDIPAESHGSSFAAPWVAAAAWVKRLVDKTGREMIRPELVRASRPVRTDIFAAVSSGGFFDPYLLLSNDGRRIVAADASTRAVIDGRIDYTQLGADPGTHVIQFCGQADADYEFYQTAGGKTILWKRPRDGPGSTVEIADGAATLTLEGQSQPEVLTIEKFMARYGEFTTRKACQ
jgi:hypothetical protein